jgi:hypothetical protein
MCALCVCQLHAAGAAVAVCARDCMPGSPGEQVGRAKRAGGVGESGGTVVESGGTVPTGTVPTRL